MVQRLERMREDRLLRWTAYASIPFLWLALALLNPLLLVLPALLGVALWKAMEYGMIERTDPIPEPDDF